MTPTKSFVKIKFLARLSTHQHQLLGPKGPKMRPFMAERELAGATFHLNHYNIQSREYFNYTKLRRSDVNRQSFEGVRNWK